MNTLRARRARAVALAVGVATALLGGLLAASPAQAWDDDDLPDYGYPWDIDRNPAFPASVDALRGHDPTCAAPALPAAQDAGSGAGYRVPLRIKLSDVIQLGGYTPESRHHGQWPYASVSVLTGWVVGYVNLPSMRVSVDPKDVTICQGFSQFAPPASNPPDADSIEVQTREDGSEFLAIPGTLLYMAYGPSDPSSNLHVRQMIASSFDAKVSGVRADGRLDMTASSRLSGLVSMWVPAQRRYTFECPLAVSATLSTADRGPVEPDRSLTHRGVPVGVPPAPDREYLPPEPLSGAVEGGHARIGSNWYSPELTGRAGLCLSSLPSALYGYNRDGINFAQENGAPTGTAADPMPIAAGTTDLSADATITDIGLPKGLPSGYGFE